MRRIVYNGILIWSFTIIKAKDPELPLCPTNMQYFPQNLPMHCRMPVGSASHISRSPLEKSPQPIPQQIPVNSFPGAMSGAVPGVFPGTIPGGMPLPMPGGFPGIPGGIPGPPGGIPMPMPMLPPPGPAHKLPVIVMPFYSQDTSDKVPQAPQRPRHKKYKKNHKKKRPKQYYSDEDSTETDTSEDDNSDSSNAGWWKNSRHSRRSNHHKSNRRKNKNRELLTPVLQYVTKDGYVIYEKQISKGEAKSWLGTKNHKDNEGETAKTVRHRQEPESREPKDEVETGFLVKEEENVETTTEDKPQVIHRKKNLKRKVSKKHI